jgi:adenylate cyclase
MSVEGVALARRLDHAFSLAFALSWLAGQSYQMHDFTRCRTAGEEAVALSERHGFPLWSGLGRFYAGIARARAEGAPDAVADAVEGLALAATTGNQAGATLMLGKLAAAQHAAGLHADARQTVEAARAVAEQTGQHLYDAELSRLEGEVFIDQDNARPQAEVCFQHALDVARSQGARTLELRAATSLARLWRNQAKRGEARELLTPIYDWFTEGFDTQDLKDAKALLKEL